MLSSATKLTSSYQPMKHTLNSVFQALVQTHRSLHMISQTGMSFLLKSDLTLESFNMVFVKLGLVRDGVVIV
jgi:hypothetical protein